MAIDANAFGPKKSSEPDYGGAATSAAAKLGPSAINTGLNYLTTGATPGWGDLAGMGLQAASAAAPYFGQTGADIGKAATTATTAFSTADGLWGAINGAGLTDYANPVMAMWNIPQTVGNLVEMFTGEQAAAMRRTIERNGQAASLQSGMVGPISGALNGGDWRSALATPVGGSTVGDGLAAVLNNNLNGTWFDTAHGWLPDPRYRGLQSLLHSAGYTGASEPTLKRVGGMGEVVAGAGGLMVPVDYGEAPWSERMVEGWSPSAPKGRSAGSACCGW
jgi:hypothetical protein